MVAQARQFLYNKKYPLYINTLAYLNTNIPGQTYVSISLSQFNKKANSLNESYSD